MTAASPRDERRCEDWSGCSEEHQALDRSLEVMRVGETSETSLHRLGRIQHYFVSTALNAGLAVAQQPPHASVREFISQLHPVLDERPLVRVGSDGDGGYLVPDDLDGIVACFSPGVDAWAPFEADLTHRGIQCFMADGSVDQPPIDGVHFIKKFLGVVNDAETIRLDNWVRESAPTTGDLLLQMDIEGSEWPVLLNASDEILRRFRIIVIELHDLERIMDRHALLIMRSVVAWLSQQFVVVHAHPNNYGGVVRKRNLVIPRVLEVTLLRKDRCRSAGFAVSFPHPLDRPNATGRVDIALPRAWYRN